MASLAIKKNIASRTTPAIRKMVVKLIDQLAVGSSQWAVGAYMGGKQFLRFLLPRVCSAHCPLPTAHCSLFLVASPHHRFYVSANVKVPFNLYA
jgi:hypothetical protein